MILRTSGQLHEIDSFSARPSEQDSFKSLEPLIVICPFPHFFGRIFGHTSDNKFRFYTSDFSNNNLPKSMFYYNHHLKLQNSDFTSNLKYGQTHKCLFRKTQIMVIIAIKAIKIHLYQGYSNH